MNVIYRRDDEGIRQTMVVHKEAALCRVMWAKQVVGEVPRWRGAGKTG